MSEHRKTHKGRQIQLVDEGEGPRLTIDEQPFDFGRDESGLFYLARFAFDRADTPLEAAARYLDYMDAHEMPFGE